MKPDKRDLALEAVLLFHSGSPWTFEKHQRWQALGWEILGQGRFQNECHPGLGSTSFEATTRILCDMVREAQRQSAASQA